MPTTDTEAVDEAGHAAHSKPADAQLGLPGKITRPIVVTFVGAGSGFCPTLCRDVLKIDGATRGELRLVDLDAERLSTMADVVRRLVRDLGRDGWKMTADVDRTKLLAGSDYVVCCIEANGLRAVDFENDIPLKYGVDQCIGDTVGPGGLFKGLRTAPAFLDLLRDVRDLAPGALVLNYTNPMSLLVLAAARAVPEVRLVGLCHSVQGTGHLLAEYAGVPYDELDWACAGINHLAWFTTLKHNGRDLYETVLLDKFRRELKEAEEERLAGKTAHGSEDPRLVKDAQRYVHDDLVRKDMCLHFGAFITESSGHLSEYLPYYRKSAAGRNLLRLGYDGGTKFYATNWPTWRAEADRQRARLVSGEESVKPERSWEYASWIIEAREKDAPFRIHGNVYNGGGALVTNLPADGAVEVSCLVDRAGVQPTRYGALPAQMAAVCRSNMAFFDLAASAAIERSVERAVHALLLDPLTSAVLTPGETRALALEMFEAERELLPKFS